MFAFNPPEFIFKIKDHVTQFNENSALSNIAQNVPVLTLDNNLKYITYQFNISSIAYGPYALINLYHGFLSCVRTSVRSCHSRVHTHKLFPNNRAFKIMSFRSRN